MIRTGSNYTKPEVVTSTGRSRIHPVNAQFLCSELPHRFYEDAAGSKLELIVQPIAETVVETHIAHGGIIGFYYQTAFAHLVNTLLLSKDGHITHINDYGYMDPSVLEDDALYMLLNPVDINGWNLTTPPCVENHQAMMRDTGMTVPDAGPRKISKALEYAILQTQRKYRHLIQA